MPLLFSSTLVLFFVTYHIHEFSGSIGRHNPPIHQPPLNRPLPILAPIAKPTNPAALTTHSLTHSPRPPTSTPKCSTKLLHLHDPTSPSILNTLNQSNHQFNPLTNITPPPKLAPLATHPPQLPTATREKLPRSQTNNNNNNNTMRRRRRRR